MGGASLTFRRARALWQSCDFMLEVFQEGGFAMYWILLLGLGALAMAVLHAAMPRKWSLIVTGILLAVIATVALFGTMDGRKKVENGAVGLEREPELKTRMLAQGYKEAMRPIQFAGLLVVVCTALVSVGQARTRKRPAPTR